MGNKKKIGKQRKDKYYNLAKETGYRSRAAFKLIQLNRKFGFLQKSRVCIDLCAAPGGWMQVAHKNMPVSSIIVGVDLFPIKSISGCISIQEDITTDKCRVTIQQTLQTWKADIVLNDGAPNVGKNWIYDAFQQACLTLSALKLATRFLREGGWFVTKVFRSKDYNPLLWVLKQLFKKVHATKPQASRSESAEIFVVCEYYLAPDKLDARFLDPKHVFEELQLEPSNKINVFHPEKIKKAKAEGYSENNYTMTYSMPVSEFLSSEDGVSALQKATEIVIDEETVANHPRTTIELKECIKDIRVLGRKDLRKILAWWKDLREERKKSAEEEEKKDAPDVDPTVLERDEEEVANAALDSKVAKLEIEEALEARRKRKQANKARRKLQTQLDLKMVLKGDKGPTYEEQELFELNDIPGEKALQTVLEQTPDVVAESDTDSDVERPSRVVKYKIDGPEHLHSSGTHYTAEESDLEELDDSNDSDYDDRSSVDGFGLKDDDDDDSDDDSDDHQQDQDKDEVLKPMPSNPLLTDLDYRKREEKLKQKASLWFQKDAFKDLDVEVPEHNEMKYLSDNLKKSCKRKTVVLNNSTEQIHEKEKEEHDDDKNSDISENLEGKEEFLNNKQAEKIDFSEILDGKNKKEKDVLNNSNKDGFEVVPVKKRKVKLHAEDLALGALMVTSKKMKRDIIDAGWHRRAFNDVGLPDWFVKDEKQHMYQKYPVSRDLVEEYEKRTAEFNVRTIKKVVQAKARKKKRALKRMERAKKKIGNIMENVDVSEREKVRQLKQLYKKVQDRKKSEVTYVVAKKHNAAKRMKRPAGVKGRYKVVDPRMKKDDRLRKTSLKNGKKPKGQKGKGGLRQNRKAAGSRRKGGSR